MAPTRAERTRAHFANQLLDRSETDVLRCVTRLVGIYSTSPTSHLALIARLDGYRPADLDRVVLEDRSLVRIGAMRGSGYFIPKAIVPTIYGATRSRRERIFKGVVGRVMDRKTYERLAKKIETLLAGNEMTTAEIRAALKEPRHAANIRYVMQLMTTECRVVATGVSGTWRSNLTSYARWSEWLPDVDPWGMEVDTAREGLARLYFTAHGPATVADFAWWSGLGKEAEGVVEVASPPDLGDGYFGTLPEAGPARGVRLLPIWDALWLSHRDRTHSVPDDLYGHVYDRSGNPTSVVLVNGIAAGHWDLTVDKSRHVVKVAPFDRFSDATKKRIATEVQRLAEALDAPDVQLQWKRRTGPLKGDWNRFMSPLKDA